MKLCGYRRVVQNGVFAFLGVGLRDVADGSEQAAADATFDDVKYLVARAAGRNTMNMGDLSQGIFSAGLIHDIPACETPINRIVADAEAIIRSRLAGFIA